MSGWLATLGWISLASTAPYFGSAFCTTVAQTYQPTFVPGFWFSFVIYVVLLTWGLVVSCFGVKMMNKFTTFSLFVSQLSTPCYSIAIAFGSSTDGNYSFLLCFSGQS